MSCAQIPKTIHDIIMFMLQNRWVNTQFQSHTCSRIVKGGCPQGGILSPLLWNLVANELLNILSKNQIWNLGYADDIVFCVVGQNITTCAEVSQFALSLIENWCSAKGLSVNPNKAEILLVSKKRKYTIPKITIFNDEIPVKPSVKYLGVHIDQRLTWATHIKIKTQKALNTFWMCRRAVGDGWGLRPKQVLWVLEAIVHPLFLHGSVGGGKLLPSLTISTKSIKLIEQVFLQPLGHSKPPQHSLLNSFLPSYQ
jgi:hypothetical protein